MIFTLENTKFDNYLYCENKSRSGSNEILYCSFFGSSKFFINKINNLKIPISFKSNIFYINEKNFEEIILNEKNIKIYSENETFEKKPFIEITINSIFPSKESINIKTIPEKIQSIGFANFILYEAADHIQFTNDYMLKNEEKEILNLREEAKKNGFFNLNFLN